MGANLSGRYGDVVVHDTIDTVSFSPAHVPSPSLKFVRVAILSLLAAILLGTVLVGPAAAFLLFGLFMVGLCMLPQLGRTEYTTLLLRIPEKTYILERFSLVEKPITLNGSASELREIMISHNITEEPVFWSGDDPVFSYWSPALKWRSKDTLKSISYDPYILGYFRYEQRAREFAEELASRLGIPVVDEPHPCQEIARRVSSQVQQARETLRNALSWLRKV